MVGHLYGAVMLVLGWAGGAQTPVLQGELCCMRILGGTGTMKSLLGRGRGLQPSHLEECALDVAEGTQLLLV